MCNREVKVNCQFGLSFHGKLLTVQKGIDGVRPPFGQRERERWWGEGAAIECLLEVLPRSLGSAVFLSAS